MNIGSLVLYKNRKCRIVADDPSPPHPAPGMNEFRYIVQDVETNESFKIANEDVPLLSPIEEIV